MASKAKAQEQSYKFLWAFWLLAGCHTSVIYVREDGAFLDGGTDARVESDGALTDVGRNDSSIVFGGLSVGPEIALAESISARPYLSPSRRQLQDPQILNIAAGISGDEYAVLWVEKQYDRSQLRFARVPREETPVRPRTGVVLDANVPADSVLEVQAIDEGFVLNWTLDASSGSRRYKRMRALRGISDAELVASASASSGSNLGERVSSAWNGDMNASIWEYDGRWRVEAGLVGRATTSAVLQATTSLFLQIRAGQEPDQFVVFDRNQPLRFFAVDRNASLLSVQARMEVQFDASFDPSINETSINNSGIIDVLSRPEGLLVLYYVWLPLEGGQPARSQYRAALIRSTDGLRISGPIDVGLAQTGRMSPTKDFGRGIGRFRLMSNQSSAQITFCYDLQCQRMTWANRASLSVQNGSLRYQIEGPDTSIDATGATFLFPLANSPGAAAVHTLGNNQPLQFVRMPSLEEYGPAPSQDVEKNWLVLRDGVSWRADGSSPVEGSSRALLGTLSGQEKPVIAGDASHLEVLFREGNTLRSSGVRLFADVTEDGADSILGNLQVGESNTPINLTPVDGLRDASGAAWFSAIRSGPNPATVGPHQFTFLKPAQASGPQEVQGSFVEPTISPWTVSVAECNGTWVASWMSFEYVTLSETRFTGRARNWVQAFDAQGARSEAVEFLASRVDGDGADTAPRAGYFGGRCAVVALGTTGSFVQAITIDEGGLRFEGEVHRTARPTFLNRIFGAAASNDSMLIVTQEGFLALVDAQLNLRWLDRPSIGGGGTSLGGEQSNRILASDGRSFLLLMRQNDRLNVERLDVQGNVLLAGTATILPNSNEHEFQISTWGHQSIYGLAPGNFVLAYQRKDNAVGAYRVFARSLVFGDRAVIQ